MFFKKSQDGKSEIVNLAYYEKMIGDLIKSFGVDPDACRHKPQNLWSLYRGSSLVYIGIFKLENLDCIEASSPILKLPSKNLLPFYRKLLELNYQFLGVKFFTKNDWVYLAENRELRGLDFEELKTLVDRVGSFANQYDDLLIEEFKAGNNNQITLNKTKIK